MENERKSETSSLTRNVRKHEDIPSEKKSSSRSGKTSSVLLGSVSSASSSFLGRPGSVLLSSTSSSMKRREESSQISLNDVLRHNPLEDEAETHIQASLEEVARKNPGVNNELHKSIFGSVPDGFLETIQEDCESEAVAPSVSDKPSTVEKLGILAEQMKEIQDRSSSVSIPTKNGDQPPSQANVLVQNAVLIRRNRADASETSKREDGGAEEAGEAGRVAALRKWGVVKTAVGLVTAPAEDTDPKKTDVPSSDNLDPEDPATEMHQLEHSVATNKIRKKKKKHLGISKALGLPDLSDFNSWARFRRQVLFRLLRITLFLTLLGTGVAAILFYLGGNPPCGTTSECRAKARAIHNSTALTGIGKDFVDAYGVGASVSWWLLFIVARHAVTLSLAILLDFWIVDFACLRTKLPTRILGSFGTLFIVQAGGWPLIFFLWGILDFCLLYGGHQLAAHWLFWQDKIDLCNANNPSGSVTTNSKYATALAMLLVVPFLVAIKRSWVGLHLGKQTFVRYAQELANLMKKAVLIGEVAGLGREIKLEGLELDDCGLNTKGAVRKLVGVEQEEGQGQEEEDAGDDDRSLSKESRCSSSFVPRKTTMAVAALSESEAAAKIDQLLDEWEEPKLDDEEAENADVASIIQFRQSLTYLNSPFPFGVAFGAAETRAECIAGVERLYSRLLESTPGRSVMAFDTLALNAIRPNGSLDQEKLKEIIHVFRPDREGNLSLLDFAKSVDAVYKELRLLRASVATSSRLDRAFEGVVNIIFYIAIIFLVLFSFKVNPIVLFASLTTFFLSFTFMFGNACANYFDGVCFIVGRKPYEIGDRINVSDVNKDTSSSGSPGWIVKNVTLYATTCVLGATNEECTYSNGSLASCRVINMARSKQAVLFFLVKFPIGTPYKKIEIFKDSIERFVKARPREWIMFCAFRPTRVEADQGFVEYNVVAKHRESWQQIGALMNSKADLFSFALELQKKMGMNYKSPPMPVEILNKDLVPAQADGIDDPTGSGYFDPVAAMFGGLDQ